VDENAYFCVVNAVNDITAVSWMCWLVCYFVQCLACYILGFPSGCECALLLFVAMGCALQGQEKNETNFSFAKL
jgi:hypothetical protein